MTITSLLCLGNAWNIGHSSGPSPSPKNLPFLLFLRTSGHQPINPIPTVESWHSSSRRYSREDLGESHWQQPGFEDHHPHKGVCRSLSRVLTRCLRWQPCAECQAIFHFALDLGAEARLPALADFIASLTRSNFLGSCNRSLSHDASGPFTQTLLHLFSCFFLSPDSLLSADNYCPHFPSKRAPNLLFIPLDLRFPWEYNRRKKFKEFLFPGTFAF